MSVTAERLSEEQSAPSGARLARYVRPALGLALPVGLALAWEIAVRLGLSDGRLVPPPSRILQEFVELWRAGELQRHVTATLLRVGAGFALGTIAGTLLGAVSGYSLLARRLLDPTLQGPGFRCSSFGSGFSKPRKSR
jgi:sulfonate transport system permease protein